jgi:hypothetical protein
MSVFTAAELEAQIAAYKAALLALASAAEYTFEPPGGTRRIVKRADLPEIRKTLEFLQNEKSKVTGARFGRTYAKQGGRGR